MPGRIEKNDIISPEIKKEFIDIEKALVSLTKILNNTTKAAVEMKKEFDSGAKTQKKVSERINKVSEDVNKLTKSEIELQKIEKQTLDIQSKIIAERTHEAKILENLRQKRKEQKKELQDEIKLKRANAAQSRVLTGSYTEIQKVLANNIIKFKSLTKAERDNSKVGKQLEKDIKRQTKALQNLDSRMGRFNRNVGRYTSAFKNLLMAFGVVGGVMAFARIITSITKKIVEFDKAQSSLAAILGKTKKEIKDLTKDAKRYGGVTEFTAKQVSELQTELAKLGFTQNEIRQSTKAVLDFASATGAELAPAAKVAGAALRAFGLDASEMNRVTSVLAVATTKSALSFSDYEAALSTVAPVAKAFGFQIEDTIAMFGKLRDSGFDASKATTATRNILLSLADTNGVLAKKLGGSVKTFDELIDGLKKLKVQGVDLNETLQMTDKRSVAAFNTFLNGAESARTLRNDLIDVNDELERMVETKLDNLAGDITKLSSAWDKFITSLEDGQGSLAKASRGIVQMMTNITRIATAASMGVKELLIEENIEENEKQAKQRLKLLKESISGIKSEESQLGELKRTQNAYNNSLKEWKQELSELEYKLANYREIRGKKARENAKSELSILTYRIIPMAEIYVDLLQMEIDKTQELINKKNEEKDIEDKLLAQREKISMKRLEPLPSRGVTVTPETLEEKLLRERKKLLDQGEEYYDQYTTNVLNIFIEYYRELLKQEEMSIKERTALETKLVDKQIELQEYLLNKKREAAEIEKEIDRAKNQAKVAIANETFNILKSFDDRGLDNLEAKKALELEIAGNNAGERERIEKKFDQERRKILRRQALVDKAQGIFNAIINTRQSVTKALTLPAPANLIVAGLMKVLGGLQIAAIAAVPIPKFKKGTKHSPEGLALVGEEGSELIEYPGGKKAITPETSTMTYLPKGSKVHPAAETKKIITNLSDQKLDELIKETRKANSRKTVVNQTLITDSGMKRIVNDSNSYVHYIDTYFRK